jgi:3-phenylpropionate/trans-cinnamate dioxygenase ferredoxin reductase subunit
VDTTGPILIVGGGVAAGSLAGTLRDAGVETDVTLVTNEPHAPYERPPLSKGVLQGEAEPETTRMHDPAWWEGQGIDLRTGRSVVDLGLETGSAALDDGTELSYGRVVLATGARPRHRELPGSELSGVHRLRTIDDSLRLRTALAGATRVVVVGGSWIGTEVAAAARAHGAETVLVTQEPVPLRAVLGETVGQVFADLHREHGVDLRAGTAVARVLGDVQAAGVELADGTTIDADVVVLGTGVVPNTGLAEQAGLDVDDGVLVDAALRTSDERVLAVGDVARHDHPRLGRLRVEHVEVARAHGATAARVLAGEDVVHDELPLFYSDQYDLGMEYVGHASPDAEVVVRGDLDGREFVAFYLDDDGRVAAGMHADVWDATDVIRELIGRRVDRDVLGDDAVDLGDLPDHTAD